MKPRPRWLAAFLALLLAVSPAAALSPDCEPPKTLGDPAWAARVSETMTGLRSSGTPGKARLEAAADDCSGEGRAFKVVRGEESQLLTRVQYRHLTQRREVEPAVLVQLARLLDVPAAAAAQPRLAADGRKADLVRSASLIDRLKNPFDERPNPGAGVPEVRPLPMKVTAGVQPAEESRSGLTTKKVPAPGSPEADASGSISGIVGGMAMIGLGAVALAGAASTPLLVVGGVLVVGGLYVAGTNMRDFYGGSFGKIGDIFGGIGK